jgi:hypothetical protein
MTVSSVPIFLRTGLRLSCIGVFMSRSGLDVAAHKKKFSSNRIARANGRRWESNEENAQPLDY